MNDTSDLRIKPGGATGCYDLLDEDGETVGQVLKKVEHYNIRSGNGKNGVTTVTWLAWYRGIKVKPDWSEGWARRKDAVAYLEYRYAQERQ